MERTEQDKVGWVVVTGATGSMGRVAARVMASEGWPVVLACRNLKKAAAVEEEILAACPSARLELMELDLARSGSVLAFIDALGGRQIAALFNNAGVMARDFRKAENGLEQDMTVNYLNVALLTLKIIPLLVPGARVVNMVSLSTRFVKFDETWKDWDGSKFSQLGTYAHSKLALLYFSIALARRYPQFRINVSDPGIVDSGMISMGRWYDPLADVLFRPFIHSPEKGVRPALAALHDNSDVSAASAREAKYYVGKRIKAVPARYTSSPLPDSIWESTLSDIAGI